MRKILTLVLTLFLVQNVSANLNSDIPNNQIDELNLYVKENLTVSCSQEGKILGGEKIKCSKGLDSDNGSCSIILETEKNLEVNKTSEWKIYSIMVGYLY